jgi:hypothetical protein
MQRLTRAVRLFQGFVEQIKDRKDGIVCFVVDVLIFVDRDMRSPGGPVNPPWVMRTCSTMVLENKKTGILRKEIDVS